MRKAIFAALAVVVIAVGAAVVVGSNSSGTHKVFTGAAKNIWDQEYAKSGFSQDQVTIVVTPSSADSSWAKYTAAGVNASVMFQSNYGFIHHENGHWVVRSYGSAQVGCPRPGGSSSYVVPTNILESFGYSCS